MATFNPQVQPTPDPYFLHLSKPIGSIDADKSTSLAISTAGEGLADVVKGADEVVKKTIEEKVYDKATAVRDQFSQQLAEADTLVRQKPELISDDGATGEATSVPGQLKGLPSTLSMLDNARANGKVSPTNYKAQLDTIASDLRSQFPGYRHYIDAQFEKVVGMNPANALVESRIQDINSFQTRINENQNKVLTYIGAHGQYPVAAGLAQKAQAGQLSMAQAIAAITPYLQSDHNLKMGTARIEQDKLVGEQAERQAAQTIGDYTSNYGAAHVNGIMITAGLDHPTRIGDYIEGVKKGTIPLPSPQQTEALTQMLTSDRAAAQAEMRAELYRKNPNDLRDPANPNSGRTPASYLKNIEDVNKHIASGSALHDTLIDLITNKETGTATAVARMSTALVDSTYYQLLQSTAKADPKDPNSRPLGQMLQMIAIGSKVGGPNVGANTLSQALGMGMGTVMGTVVSKMSTDLTTPEGRRQSADPRTGATYYGQQPPGATPPAAGPRPQAALPPSPTMNETVEAAIQRGVPPAGVKIITNLPTIISDPKQPDEKKLAIAKNTFSRENIPLLNNFVRENRDPDSGKVQGGQYSTFRTYGAIAPDVVKLDKAQPGNNVLTNYKNWMEVSFSHVLFPSELKDLSQFKATTNVDFQYSNMPGEPPKIIPVWPKPNPNYTGPGLDPAVDPTFVKYAKPQIQASVDRLNSGLATMSNVAQSIPGMDVNAYIYQLFAANRVQGTVPDQILQAIHSSRPDLVQKYTADVEEAGNLQNFLKDPGRGAPKSKNNAPAASARAPGGMNLGEILGVKVDNIPNGMTAKEFLRLLKEREAPNNPADVPPLPLDELIRRQRAR